MVAIQFEDLFKRFNDDLVRLTDRYLNKKSASQFDVSAYMNNKQITLGLTNSISTVSLIFLLFQAFYIQLFPKGCTCTTVYVH